mmetsp:Transcript_46643/g.89082  ORF Transcript_46643/g.89082 Transcript_46643/m.89082 type:complete len:237 (-) Transcript_46643:115-825(-)|eukprot:CAMPEP_0114290964 /NCGR_PEP_ID=MMETSP0059-20121206/8229_1 /TAXON_ID=36894 /ORGANISM="Pyramimonas parkeae, Strain CCMP726" /LENGTH=236 /DNA_ID=CAMNT_0001412421 /DNA_START=460 /DNA_END=1170 /DNA_ORIENTATION=-
MDSGLQVKEDRVGQIEDAPVDYGNTIRVRWRAWTVHQGRSLGPWQDLTFVLTCPYGPRGIDMPYAMASSTLALDSETQVMPAWHEALRGMKPGGTRRFLVPPLPWLSYPYIPLESSTLDKDRKFTKLGMAPVAPFSQGIQSISSGIGPVPADPKGAAFLESVVSTNAFTIKLPDRAILFDVECLEIDGSRASGIRTRGPTIESMGGGQLALKRPNPAGMDGGASWWTLALPAQGEG